MSKSHVFLLLVVMTFIALGLSSCKDNAKLSDLIVNKIDQVCDDSGYCTIDLTELVDFAWDKAVFFETSCTSESVSALLEIDFKEMNDMNYGMVFAYQNKIVYSEVFFEAVETPNRFWIRLFKSKGSGGNCELITPDNAVVDAKRFFYEKEKRNCYTIEPGGYTQDFPPD